MSQGDMNNNHILLTNKVNSTNNNNSNNLQQQSSSNYPGNLQMFNQFSNNSNYGGLPQNNSATTTTNNNNAASISQLQEFQQQQQQQNIQFMQVNQQQSSSSKALKKAMNSSSVQFVPQAEQSTTVQPVPNFLQTPNMYQGNSGQQMQQIGINQPIEGLVQNSQLSPEEQNEQDKELENIVQNILNLRKPEKREEALQELSKKRETYPNLAPLLWHSVGTIAILIQDIVAIYHSLSPPNLTPTNSSRVCSVLGLLQCLALHTEIKGYFLSAHIPLFLYPFLNTSNRSKPFENLRVTSLGVIGALVKGDDTDAITFLMQTEIIPLCLRIMKRGQELSRTVATFIVQKILLDENGLNYICQTAERFFAVSTVLQSMIEDLESSEKEDQRLLRHIIRCYLRLSENQRANEALKKCIPDVLKQENSKLITDEVVKRWHSQLLINLGILVNNDQQQQSQMPQMSLNH